MAKFFTNPLIEGISGLIGKSMVAMLRWDVLPIRGIQASGILRRLGQHASYGQILLNIRHSFSLVAGVWNGMTISEQQSWQTQAGVLAQSNSVFYSAYDYFLAYTMSLYGARFGSGVFMDSLTSTATWDWADRTNFVWTPTV